MYYGLGGIAESPLPCPPYDITTCLPGNLLIYLMIKAIYSATITPLHVSEILNIIIGLFCVYSATITPPGYREGKMAAAL